MKSSIGIRYIKVVSEGKLEIINKTKCFLVEQFRMVPKLLLTNCLRVIRNVWHFCYALRLVFKVVCGSLGIALLTP